MGLRNPVRVVVKASIKTLTASGAEGKGKERRTPAGLKNMFRVVPNGGKTEALLRVLEEERDRGVDEGEVGGGKFIVYMATCNQVDYFYRVRSRSRLRCSGHHSAADAPSSCSRSCRSCLSSPTTRSRPCTATCRQQRGRRRSPSSRRIRRRRSRPLSCCAPTSPRAGSTCPTSTSSSSTTHRSTRRRLPTAAAGPRAQAAKAGPSSLCSRAARRTTSSSSTSAASRSRRTRRRRRLPRRPRPRRRPRPPGPTTRRRSSRTCVPSS